MLSFFKNKALCLFLSILCALFLSISIGASLIAEVCPVDELLCGV